MRVIRLQDSLYFLVDNSRKWGYLGHWEEKLKYFFARYNKEKINYLK